MTPHSAETIEVKLAGRRLVVPVVGDETTTRQAAEWVNERLRHIEDESTRVDTQVFALRSALHFAAELVQLREEAEQDNRQLIKALDSIASALRGLVDELNATAG